MYKRILSLILALILIFTAASLSVFAEETESTGETLPPEETGSTPSPEPEKMGISEEGIAVLKAEEGFSVKPYWDYAQWTVGYGTKCPDDMLEYYKQYGITETEAESLLRTYLTAFEAELHKFMERTGVELKQNQFDALMLFTYNCGSGWSYSTGGIFYNAIVSGATGNRLIDAFSRWCSAGGEILPGLLRRRLCEANMYLNGQYSQSIPANFGYVIYDASGGKTSPSVQGFHTDLTDTISTTPSREGYRFEGWYTAKTGGTKVEKLDSSVRNKRLYARWTDNDAAEPEKGVTVTVTGQGVNLRSGAGTNYSVVGTANKGDQFVITETVKDSRYTWGKFATGWICLDYTDYKKPEPEPDKTPVPAPQTQMGTVKVTDTLRIRSGPSTGYSIAGYLQNGDRVEILEQQIAGTMIWGRIDKGWISLSYVVLDKVEEPAKPEPDTEKPMATGTVKVSEFLRIRSGAGTSYAVAGYLTNGTKVSILEIRETATMTWGKIDKGWISLDYVVLDKTETETPKTVTGTVKVEDFLRIRSGPGTSYAIAGYLENGTKLEILEQKTMGGVIWGKISKGWVSLSYVVLDQQQTEPETVFRTVTADCLRIRSGAGTSYTIVDYLYAGAKVEILEQKTVDGTLWGKTAKGWISMDYVK